MADLSSRQTYTFLTRTKAFQRLVAWAFSACDNDKTGEINKSELYAGILLVHVTLAKYAGAAACYPPTRQVIDELFEASDTDKSGTILEEEFTQIMVIFVQLIYY
jgi:Ca2+-binding EF-hand superfamily protein